MIVTLINHLEKYTPLNNEEKKYLETNIPVKTVPKSHFILKEGDISNEFYFIIRGSVRLFYQMEMEEKNAYFYFENMFVSSYESFIKKTPARHNLEAMEESTLAVISDEIAGQLLQKFPKFEFLARIMMEEELITNQEIIASFTSLNAEKRYLQLLSSNKDLLQRIPQYHLASYLGVAPETLSRIRKRITL